MPYPFVMASAVYFNFRDRTMPYPFVLVEGVSNFVPSALYSLHDVPRRYPSFPNCVGYNPTTAMHLPLG